MYNFIKHLAILSLVTLPFGLSVAPLIFIQNELGQLLWMAVAPLIFIGAFTGTAIGYSRLGTKAMIAGRFERKMSDKVYGPRAVHGTMWTAIYYFKPLYWLLLSNTFTKTLLLRGFGYKGSISATLYPDTWVRDLPLLKLGKGAYLANRATIGTNIVMDDGSILVDEIVVGEHSIIGHLAILAPGSRVGHHTEIGAGTVIGLMSSVGDNCKLGSKIDIDHGTIIGNGIRIDARACIGRRVKITGEGIVIPRNAHIPHGVRIECQQDVDRIVKARPQTLENVLGLPRTSLLS